MDSHLTFIRICVHLTPDHCLWKAIGLVLGKWATQSSLVIVWVVALRINVART